MARIDCETLIAMRQGIILVGILKFRVANIPTAPAPNTNMNTL